MKHFVLSLIASFVLAFAATAEKRVDGTVSGGVIRPMALAIPDFLPESGGDPALGKNIKDVVVNDLVSTGLFQKMPETAYLEGSGGVDASVNFASWSGIGAEILVEGSIGRSGDQVTARFRVYDVIAGREIGEGVSFSGPSGDWRRIAHKTADSIYTRTTGEGPYFDSRVVYVAEKGPKNARQKAIAVMDSDGANLRYLTSGNEIVLAPRFAPNARDIIYTSYISGQPQVMMMDTATGATRSMGDLPGLTFAPRFSPNGNSLLLSVTDQAANTDLFRLDLGSGKRTRLTTDAGIDTAPDFSPDGSQIVFESDRSGSQQLYVMPAGGGDARQISNGKGRYATPVWSPRGDLIAFTKIEGGQFHIGVMGKDGSNERTLTTSFIDESPSWAPNGRVLMFFRETAGSSGAPELYSISLTGQNMVQIPTPEYASDPNWSRLLK